MQDSIVVLQGQFLERMTPIAAGEPAGSVYLDGLYHRGDRKPSVLIAPPHPRAGGSMETTLVAELAWALTRAGHATLRFNYRGVGASQGEMGDEDVDLLDVLAALSHLADTEGGRIALCGVGHGALACLRAAVEQTRIDTLVIVGQIPSAEDAARALSRLSAREGGAPRVLVAVGEPLEDAGIGEAVASLGASCEVAVIEGAGAGFTRCLPEAARRVARFYAG